MAKQDSFLTEEQCRNLSDMEKANEQTLKWLLANEIVELPKDAALIQLLRELSKTIGIGSLFGKTVVANAAVQYNEIISALVPPSAGSQDELLAEMNNAQK